MASGFVISRYESIWFESISQETLKLSFVKLLITIFEEVIQFQCDIVLDNLHDHLTILPYSSCVKENLELGQEFEHELRQKRPTLDLVSAWVLWRKHLGVINIKH